MIYRLSIEPREPDAIHFAETVGMKAQTGDETRGNGITFCHHRFIVDANGNSPLPDEDFQVMPLMDVGGEGGEIVVLPIDDLVAKLGADTTRAAGHRQGAIHKTFLAIDLGHDPGTGGIAHLGHSNSRRQAKIIGVSRDVRREKGIEIDPGFVRIDLTRDKRLPVQTQNAPVNGGIGMDIGGLAADERLLAIEEPFVGGDADIDRLYDPVIGEKLGRVIAGLIVDIGERMVVLIDAHPPVPVPGLLDEKAVAPEAVNVIGEDHGVGYGVWRGPANGEGRFTPFHHRPG